jgi:hypothetical protein
MIQYQIVYYSEATKLFTEQEIIDLLTKANQYNSARGITGCLVYANNKFIQLLEGEHDKVVELYEKIKKDPRHNNILTVIEMSVSQKLFPNWGMGFKFSEKATFNTSGAIDCAKWIYSEFNSEASPGKEAIFNFAVRQGLMKSQVLPF